MLKTFVGFIVGFFGSVLFRKARRKRLINERLDAVIHPRKDLL